MAGRLIVFEGTDGSGKSTQFQALCRRVTQSGRDYQKLVFPQYKEPSSALIRMYLAGEFGTHPQDVNPYAASAFYAVDRYASLKKVWGEYYEQGGLVLTDRYTTSNAVHQAVKCAPQERAVADGKFVTGHACGSSFDFGLKLVEVLRGKEVADEINGRIFYYR